MNFKSTPLYSYTNSISIRPDEMTRITLPASVKTGSRSLRFVQTVYENSASVFRFAPKSCVNVKIFYEGESYYETFSVYLNRDFEAENGYFKNESILNLQGKTVTSIVVEIGNYADSTENLIISDFSFFESEDLNKTVLVEVLEERTINSDIIHATANFSDSMFTQYLRTNVFSMEAIRPAVEKCNYLVAEEWNLSFYTAALSSTEKEHFHITITKGNTSEDVYFYYAEIGDSDTSYKYLTTLSPKEKWGNAITDEEAEKFKFYVWKTNSLAKKLSIEFATTEGGNSTPVIVLGAGDGQGGYSNQLLLYKDETGGYMRYVYDGDSSGLIIDQTGLYLKGCRNVFELLKEYNKCFEIKFAHDDLFVFEPLYDGETLTGFKIGDSSALYQRVNQDYPEGYSS